MKHVLGDRVFFRFDQRQHAFGDHRFTGPRFLDQTDGFDRCDIERHVVQHIGRRIGESVIGFSDEVDGQAWSGTLSLAQVAGNVRHADRQQCGKFLVAAVEAFIATLVKRTTARLRQGWRRRAKNGVEAGACLGLCSELP